MLVDSNGSPLNKESRREMKSGVTHSTPYGDVHFVLKVDVPADFPQDNFNEAVIKYSQILHEAFSRKV